MVWVPALAGLPREQYLRGHSSSPRLQLGILISVCVCVGGGLSLCLPGRLSLLYPSWGRM